MVDRETIIEAGDGGAAGIVAGLLVVALFVVGVFYLFGMNHGGAQTITVEVPKVSVSVAPNGQ